MSLSDVDLASVPAEHLASLTSSVMNTFYIVDVRVWCRRGQRRPGQEVAELEAAEEKQPLMR